MMNKSNNNYNISECRVVFTYFNHFSPLNSTRARIKLGCKVGYFNLLSSERGDLLRYE